MQYKVVIGEDKGVSDIILIVRELQSQHKLVLDVDFQFSYHPPEYHFYTSHHTPRHTEFRFADAKHATFFTLKYL
jgi:hypothetical protein